MAASNNEELDSAAKIIKDFQNPSVGLAYLIENRKKIAEKNWILTAYDENAGDNTSAISDVNQGKAAPAPANSAGKGTAKNSTEQGNGMKFRATEEAQGIIDEAKKNGIYMKAPNGQPTNLNEKQWAQVRTKAFKKWFGNWEKVLRIAKLRKSKPVEITGKEISEGEITKKDALEYGKNPNVSEYQHYICGLNIGGISYTVHSLIAVDSNGNRYYDHNLTRIEKTKLLDLIEGQAVGGKDFGTMPDTKSTILSGYKGKRLFSLLQANASKVVDENGNAPTQKRKASNGSPQRHIIISRK